MGRRDPDTPYEDAANLPVPEVGDHGSFEREPDGGWPDAEPPELERLDVTADEPPAEDDNPLGGVL